MHGFFSESVKRSVLKDTVGGINSRKSIGRPLASRCERGAAIIARVERGFDMSFLAWIVLGLLAGFIGSKLVNNRGEGALMDILLGIVGAIVGGWLFNTFGAAGVTGLNIYSLLVAVVGSVVFLMLYHALRRV
jgi:uncharacterized membrane protein YeaQ/YmgE (transglycosylase-associated protein family)